MTCSAAAIALPAAPAAHAGSHLAGRRLRLHRDRDAERLDTEQFIARIYAEHFDARIGAVLAAAPTLVSIADEDGRPVAAAGYRRAGGPLFLENYLPHPVEAAIAAAGSVPVQRATIAEVGHFASGRAGEGRRLMVLLGRHLVAEGFSWVVSTATAELRSVFARLGIAPLTLGHADPMVLGDGAARWGSYYTHAPLVLAGEIRANLARFDRG